MLVGGGVFTVCLETFQNKCQVHFSGSKQNKILLFLFCCFSQARFELVTNLSKKLMLTPKMNLVLVDRAGWWHFFTKNQIRQNDVFTTSNYNFLNFKVFLSLLSMTKWTKQYPWCDLLAVFVCLPFSSKGKIRNKLCLEW